MSAKTKVTKTKTALKHGTYNLSDLKHDLNCGGFVELGGSASVSSWPIPSTPKLSSSKFIPIALSLLSFKLLLIWALAPSFC